MKGSEVTQILEQVQSGDAGASDRLFTLVYDELRERAGGLMRRQRVGHTLQATALAHEGFLRLMSSGTLNVRSRRHLMNALSKAMLHVLIDHAKSRNAAKRGGEHTRVPLDGVEVALGSTSADILDVHAALERLREREPRSEEIVRLRFFGGFTVKEIAEILEMSPRSVEREWTSLRALLERWLA